MIDKGWTQSEFVHIVLVDEEITPQGWRVWCVPHGHLGTCWYRPDAVLIGLEHDIIYGGGSAR